MVKLCGPRKSKLHPDVYTKEELIEIVVRDYNIVKSKASRLTKEELCKIIKNLQSESLKKTVDFKNSQSESLKETVGFKKKEESSDESKDESSDESEDEWIDTKRQCGPRKIKSNNAYSKEELVNLAVKRGYKKSVALKMKVSELCIKLSKSIESESESSEDEKDIEDFDYRICNTYSTSDLRKFAKNIDLDNNGDRHHLCESLVTEEINKLQNKCLQMDMEDIKYFADSHKINTSGTKKELCYRLFNLERIKAKIDVYIDRESFIQFYEEYEDSSFSQRKKLITKYKDIFPSKFIKKFLEMDDEIKEEFSESLSLSENKDKNVYIYIYEFDNK